MAMRHYGVFQFKEGTTEADIEGCFSAMMGMVGKIPGLESMEYGPYDSAEGLNDGFTHGFDVLRGGCDWTAVPSGFTCVGDRLH